MTNNEIALLRACMDTMGLLDVQKLIQQARRHAERKLAESARPGDVVATALAELLGDSAVGADKNLARIDVDPWAAIEYIVRNDGKHGRAGAPEGGTELSMYYDPDDGRYHVFISAGEMTAGAQGPYLAEAVLAARRCEEGTAVVLDDEGRLLCFECLGETPAVDDCRWCEAGSPKEPPHGFTPGERIKADQ